MSPQMGEVTTVDVNALIAAHAAILDAHTKDAFEIVRIGEYTTLMPNNKVGNKTLAANRLYATPLIVARAMTFDRIAIDVRVADAGKNCRLGIYKNGTNYYPGALVLDAGIVSVNAVAVVSIVIDQSLTKGIYHLACLSEAGP